MAVEEDEQISDDDIPENVHNRLLGAVSNLYKQKRIKAPVRKEPSLKVSEFHLSSIKPENRKSGKIDLSDLTKVLDKRAGLNKINEQIKSAKKKSRKLPKPLEKPQADKLERSVGYENLKKDLNKWDPIVYHQRVSEHVSFPLKEPKMLVHKDPNDFLTTFKTPTELELQLAESLNSSELLKKEKEEEELNSFKLSLEEIKEQRSIMARLRAQLSYKAAKAARQNRIKSKKFHRIQRKEKLKNQIKEFEELQKTDPEAALKKLEQLEKARAQERASLRHRTTGQWARNLAVRAKYNKDARIALSEQLAKSRELTQKLKADSASEDENESEDEEKETLNDNNNSWLKKDPANEVEEFYARYKEYENEKEKEIERNDFKVTDASNGKESSTMGVSSNHVVASHSKPNKFISENIVGRAEKTNVKSQDLKSDFVSSNSCNKTKSKKNCREIDKGKLNLSDGCNGIVEIQFSVLKKFPMKVKLNGVVPTIKDDESNEKPMKQKLPIESGSWSVTEIKKDNFNSKDQNFLKNKAKRKQKKSSSSSNVPVKIVKKQTDIDDMFYDVEEKLTNEVENKINKIRSMIETDNLEDHSNIVHADDDKYDKSYLEMRKRRVQTEIDEELIETPSGYSHDDTQNKIVNSSKKSISKNNDSVASKNSGNIKPNNFLYAKPKQLNTELPSSLASAEDNLDDLDSEDKANDNSMTISEAFACDDVDEEFKQEKEEDVKKSLIEDVNLVLPGWGSWGGPNVKVPKRKSKRFIIKFPKKMPRKDENKGNVVINEDKDEKIKPHLVTELPFPFTSVKEYEASIRAPLGRTWLPQSAHLKLIEPAVTTKLGTVIEPMTKDQIVKHKHEWK